MTYYTRSDWGARARRAAYNFGGSDVDGIALHWPAMRTRRTTVASVMQALRSWQRFHMDTRGWSDIAYQEAIDQAGNVYELRGLEHQSGANGNQDLNNRYGALLLVLAPGEKPTAAMVSAVRDRIARHRELHPSSHLVVGHGQIRPGGTTCPGPITQRLIDDGAFTPTEDDMAFTKDDRALLKKVSDQLTGLRQKEARRWQIHIKELRDQGKTADEILASIEQRAREESEPGGA